MFFVFKLLCPTAVRQVVCGLGATCPTTVRQDAFGCPTANGGVRQQILLSDGAVCCQTVRQHTEVSDNKVCRPTVPFAVRQAVRQQTEVSDNKVCRPTVPFAVRKQPVACPTPVRQVAPSSRSPVRQCQTSRSVFRSSGRQCQAGRSAEKKTEGNT